MKKINIKFDKEIINKLPAILIRYKFFILLIYLTALSFFMFKVVYEDAYVKVRYIEYVESEDRVISNLKIANRLSLKIIEQINSNEPDVKENKEYKYKNPFMFTELKKKDNNIESENKLDISLENSNAMININNVNVEAIDQN